MTDASPGPAHPARLTDHAADSVVGELLAELRASREATLAQQVEMARERTRERRWRTLSRLLIFGVPVLMGLIYALSIAGIAGMGRSSPRAESVGIVRIDGEIGADQTASAKNIIPALRRAFESPKTRAVVLSIDSPGGAPVEAERINDALAALKKKHPKEVVAVIHNIGASAAYMIAMHADKVYAGKYSLVGSIGAIMSSWELHRALAKFDVAQRTYASGPLKSMLNPFEPMTPQADAKANALVSQIGKAFAAELAAQRGKHLKAGTDYATGEVWQGTEAKTLGLVDEIGTLDQVVNDKWGVAMHDFGPRRDEFGMFGNLVQKSMESLARALVSEARVGLR